MKGGVIKNYRRSARIIKSLQTKDAQSYEQNI